MRDLFRLEADLARASAGIADREHRYGVTFATVALGAAGAVANNAFEQGSAQDVASVGEARGKAVAFAGGLLMFHYQ